MIRIGVLAVALWTAHAFAQTTVILRDGQSPTTAYAGTRDVTIANSVETIWDPAVSYYGLPLAVDGIPVDKSVLMRWDLGGVTLAGAVITGVKLTLTTSSGGGPYALYAVNQQWDEQQATGKVAAANAPWAAAGATSVPADHGAEVLGELQAIATGILEVPLNAAGVALVQKWVDGAAPNYGFIVQGLDGADGLDFANMQAQPASSRPMLSVTYTNASGTFTVHFQNGVAPSANYFGGTGVTIANGRGPGYENFNPGVLRLVQSEPSSALIGFDLAPVPDGARITGAALHFNVINASTDSFEVYPQWTAWEETRAAWLTPDGAGAWQAAGNLGLDHGADPIATVQGPALGAIRVPLNALGVQLLQSWVSGAKANNGFFLHAHLTTGADGLELTPRESQNVSNRPGLELTYLPPIRLTPSVTAAAPNTKVQFLAEGGAADAYTWSLSSAPSGGTIDQSGLYLAGPTSGTIDVVKVSDSAGTFATAKVYVGELQLHPVSSSVAPGAEVGFEVLGGQEPFVFTVEPNLSGATISEVGLYRAGTKAGTDRVVVMDAAGTFAYAEVKVGARASTGAVVTFGSDSVQPGGSVQLRGEISNDSSYLLAGGRARFELEGLEFKHADEGEFDEACGCFLIELAPGQTTTVKQTVAVSNARGTVKARLVIEDRAGELARAEAQAQSGEIVTDLGGCGCSGTGLAGLGWALLALAFGWRRGRSA